MTGRYLLDTNVAIALFAQGAPRSWSACDSPRASILCSGGCEGTLLPSLTRVFFDSPAWDGSGDPDPEFAYGNWRRYAR